MIFALCVLFNILVVAYFGITKRKLLAAFYAVALCFFSAMVLFPINTEAGVAFWSSLLGDWVAEYAPWIAEFCSQEALSPLSGLQLLSILIAIIFSLKAVDCVHEYRARKSSRLYDEAHRPRRDPPVRESEDAPAPCFYLTFCSFRC